MMVENFLRTLYQNFLKLDKHYFFLDSKKYSTSLSKIKIPDKVLNEFYENYEKIPFFEFLQKLKTILYSKKVFDFILKNSSEDWDLWPYLEILEKEKVLKIKRDGSVSVLKKEILKLIPPPLEEEEIRKKIEKSLKIKIRDKEPVINLFKKFYDFKIKPEWDQMPISQGSALFLTKKILEKLPLNKKFLFVGDDDFISVILSLANPKIESLVIDVDEELLDCISFLAKKFHLKIETRKIDIRKEKKLREKFVGFLTNPVYTETGIKEFVSYGVNQLGEDGGEVFVEIGDEAIGNRFLFLQEFFAKKNLILEELIPGKIYYPQIQLYKEDREILRRLGSKIDEKVIKNSPKIGASLWIFSFLPFSPKKVKFKKPIYAYL